MQQHKHAAVLRAIADGVPLSEFEILWDAIPEPIALEMRPEWLVDENVEIRRKPQYILVNGFKVPKPLDVGAQINSVWVPDFEREGLAFCYNSDGIIMRLLKHGCAHATQEAAIAHAKAMLGIDPEFETN